METWFLRHKTKFITITAIILCGIIVLVCTFGVPNFTITLLRHNSNLHSNFFAFKGKEYFVVGTWYDNVARNIVNEADEGNLTCVAEITVDIGNDYDCSFGNWLTEAGSIFCTIEIWKMNRRLQYGSLIKTHIVEVNLATGKHLRNFNLGKNELFLAIQGDYIFLFNKGEYYARNMNDLSERISLDTIPINWYALDIYKEVNFYISDDGIQVLHKNLTYDIPGKNSLAKGALVPR